MQKLFFTLFTKARVSGSHGGLRGEPGTVGLSPAVRYGTHWEEGHRPGRRRSEPQGHRGQLNLTARAGVARLCPTERKEEEG